MKRNSDYSFNNMPPFTSSPDANTPAAAFTSVSRRTQDRKQAMDETNCNQHNSPSSTWNINQANGQPSTHTRNKKEKETSSPSRSTRVAEYEGEDIARPVHWSQIWRESVEDQRVRFESLSLEDQEKVQEWLDLDVVNATADAGSGSEKKIASSSFKTAKRGPATKSENPPLPPPPSFSDDKGENSSKDKSRPKFHLENKDTRKSKENGSGSDWEMVEEKDAEEGWEFLEGASVEDDWNFVPEAERFKVKKNLTFNQGNREVI